MKLQTKGVKKRVVFKNSLILESNFFSPFLSTIYRSNEASEKNLKFPHFTRGQISALKPNFSLMVLMLLIRGVKLDVHRGGGRLHLQG